MTIAIVKGKLLKAKKSGIIFNMTVASNGNLTLNNASQDAVSLIHSLVSLSAYELERAGNQVTFTKLYATGREVFEVYNQVFNN